jgi:hypothetical protein
MQLDIKKFFEGLIGGLACALGSAPHLLVWVHAIVAERFRAGWTGEDGQGRFRDENTVVGNEIEAGGEAIELQVSIKKSERMKSYSPSAHSFVF